jgi:predicted membrane-bound spermidine synthase
VRGAARVAPALSAAFLSGAAALVFETLWFHQAGLAFGHGVWAASLVLAAFMAGVALGSGLGARAGDRVRVVWRVYALLEVATAVTGVALVLSLPALDGLFAPLAQSLASTPLALGAVRFGAAFALLAVPATAMGMTLPLLVRALSARDANFGRVLGVLYGVNTLGAVLGCVSSEAVLLGAFGIRGTALCAAACDVVAALIALGLARADVASSPESVVVAADARAEAAARGRGARAWPWLLAGALSGFALLALEVVWLRFLLLFLNDTPLAFALILALVLTGIALGGLVGSAWSARAAAQQPVVHARRAAWAAHAAGVCGLLGYLAYPKLLSRYFEPDQSASTVLAVAAGLILPAALASGALFTLLGAALRDASASAAQATGRLSLFNTVGAGLGSLIAGFVLLPQLGMERALFALFATYGAIGALLLAECGLRPALRFGATAAFALAMAGFPFGQVRASFIEASARRWMAAGDRVAAVREGLTGTLVHIVHARGGLPLFDQLATNAYSMSVNDFAARRYMKLFAELPAAIHPRIARALVVGYGIGNTAEALVANPDVAWIDVADISRDILAMSRAITPAMGAHPLDDRRVHVHVEDGRQFLAGTSSRYDLITGEPPPPVMAGVVNLYTREYFELVRARLAPGGIASYWLPMMNISAGTAKALIGAFCAAFDDCSLWHGSARNFILIGTRGAGARGPVSAESFARAFTGGGARAAELQAIGVELPAQLGALFIGDAVYLRQLAKGSAPLSDDWPERMHQPGTKEERDALIWQWRDTAAARARFASSALVAALFPSEVRTAAARQFENQRLINDLLFPEQTPARQTMVLHQVLRGTPLRFPVLLLLGSDPDVQRALARAPRATREARAWNVHRLAGMLADRDYRAAFMLAARMKPAELPLDDLFAYLDYAVQAPASPSARRP